MSTSAWGVDHGEVSKGLGSAFKGLARKLPGGELRHAKKLVAQQPKKPVMDPGKSFMDADYGQPPKIGPMPSLGNQGRTVRTSVKPHYGKKSPAEAGWRPTNRHVT